MRNFSICLFFYADDDERVGPQQVCQTLSSSESVLSAAGSMVVEENASEASEPSSTDSGVYKNIIINLGSLTSPLNTPSGRGSTISTAYTRPAPVPSGYFYNSNAGSAAQQLASMSASGSLPHFSGSHVPSASSSHSVYGGPMASASGRYMAINNNLPGPSSNQNNNSELVGILKKTR